jgi:hypothetical protein
VNRRNQHFPGDVQIPFVVALRWRSMIMSRIGRRSS